MLRLFILLVLLALLAFGSIYLISCASSSSNKALSTDQTTTSTTSTTLAAGGTTSTTASVAATTTTSTTTTTLGGAYNSGAYPSAAALAGSSFTQEQADARCSAAWEYFKTELLAADGAVVRPEPEGRVVSEGQSYGMMLALQNNDQAAFDLIWNWTKTHMQSGQPFGLFAWLCEADGTQVDSHTAPDADEMIAMALLFASRRWSDRAAPYNYSVQAEEILENILEYEVTADNFLVHAPSRLPGDPDWYNPSYLMPAFYRLFAIYTGNSRWNSVAESSYTLINNCLKSEYGNLENGLVPDYCHKDGSLMEDHQTFFYDAMRTPWFISLDQVWFDEPAATTYLNKVVGFFAPIYNDFGDGYTLDGREFSSSHVGSWLGSMAGGAMGTSSSTYQVNLFNHLMATEFPADEFRYYNICWLNFGLLLSSGNFRIY